MVVGFCKNCISAGIFFEKKSFFTFLTIAFLFFSPPCLSFLCIYSSFSFPPLPFYGGNLPFFLLNLSYSKAITEAPRIYVWMILTASASFCVLHLIGKNKSGKKCCSSSSFHGNVPPLTFPVQSKLPTNPLHWLWKHLKCVTWKPSLKWW